VKRTFQQNQDRWNPEAFGRLKTTADAATNSQKDLFDGRFATALEGQFQTRLKELLEYTFKDIESAYREVQGRSPRISPLFEFLFRFVTAKIFMDRADAKGWKDFKEPLEILQ